MSSTQEKLEELFINHKVYFLIPDGQKLKRQIIGLFQRDTKALIDSAKREAYKEGYILGGIDVLTKQETARTVQMAKDIEQDNDKRD